MAAGYELSMSVENVPEQVGKCRVNGVRGHPEAVRGARSDPWRFLIVNEESAADGLD
jgi:hypothetical protein